MTRKIAVATAWAGIGLVLAACGGQGQAEPPTFDADETPSATPTPTPTDDGKIPKVPIDGEVARGLSAAVTPAEKQVVDVWIAYWSELVRMYRTTEADRDTLYSLATDEAASGPLDYVATMRDRGETQTGGVVAAVESVEIAGDRAVIAGCLRNTTVNLARNGRPAEQISPFLTSRDTLRKEGPDWRVTKSRITSRDRKCEYR